MKRFLIALLSIFVCIFLLASCSGPDSSGGNTDGGNEDYVVKDDNVIFSSEVAVQIVYVPGNVDEKNIDEIFYEVSQNARSVRLVTDTAEKITHEVVIGKTKRDVSQKAYRQLEKLEKESEEYLGYCIYSDGKSVAIAYDEAFLGVRAAEQTVVDYFLSKYCKKSALKLNSGVVDIEQVNAIEYQEGLDAAATAAKWEKLEENLTEKFGKKSSEAIVAAFKELYTLYTDDMIDWFANLYDPVTGGFYYSNSARNSEGYLPDLESTNQALGFIATSGMINGQLKDFIPEDMQKQIVAFVKSTQDPINGYFYHPQWERKDSDAHPERLGRDVTNAVKTLEYFGHIPLYDAPNGTKGENPVGIAPVAKLTERLLASNVSAVSKVISTSGEAGVPEYLLNEKNFSEYLAKYDDKIETDAYWVGNLFESMATQIVQRDKVLAARGETYSLAKMATDWLTSHQDPETGLWEAYEGQEYDCVNGILKISSAYNKMGYPVPNALKLLNYAVDAITSTADPHHVCCVLNTWYAITVLSTNISSFSPTAEADIAKIRDECIPDYPKMIRATRDKYSLFVKEDGASKGGFSYFQDRTSNTSQGMKVALDNVNEADVNSTYICSAGAMGHIFGFLDERAINLFTPADGMRFLVILEGLGVITKDKEIDPIPIEYDDTTIEGLVGDGLLDLWLPNGELAIEEGRPYGDSSKVMRFTADGKNDLFQLRLTKPQGSFNAVAFETDIMFMPEAASTYELLMYGNQSTTRHTNPMFKVVPNDGVYVYGIDIPETKIADVGSWFNLRVEYGRVNNITVKTDIYVNRTLKASGAAPYGAEAQPASLLSRIQFSAYHASSAKGDVYFDNTFLEQFTKKNLPTLPDVDLGPSETDTGILNFDFKALGAYINQGLLDQWIQTGSLSIVDSAPYGKESKVLELVAAGNQSNLFQLKLTKTQESYNAISFETDVMFDTTAPSVYELLFFGNPAANRGGHMLFSTDNTSVYVEGDDTSTIKIAELKEWFRLKVVYTKVSDTRVCMEVFVGDKSMAISTSPLGSTVFTAKDMIRIQFSSYSEASADGAVQFDNTGLTQITYELPKLPEENLPEGPSEAETGLLTFDAKTLNGYKSAGLIDMYTTTGSLSILDGKNYGWDSNVLELKASGKNSNLVQLKVTKTAESFNALSFETYIMFTADAPSVYELLFFGSSSSLKGGHLLFSANDDGVYVHGDDLELTKIASLNDHFHLKVVYAKADDTRICMEVFVNNISVAKSTAPYGDTVFEAKEMTRIQFSSYHESSATGGVYFDNTGLLQISYELPELPKPTPTPTPEPTPTPTPSDSPYDNEENVSGEDWT